MANNVRRPHFQPRPLTVEELEGRLTLSASAAQMPLTAATGIVRPDGAEGMAPEQNSAEQAEYTYVPAATKANVGPLSAVAEKAEYSSSSSTPAYTPDRSVKPDEATERYATPTPPPFSVLAQPVPSVVPFASTAAPIVAAPTADVGPRHEPIGAPPIVEPSPAIAAVPVKVADVGRSGVGPLPTIEPEVVGVGAKEDTSTALGPAVDRTVVVAAAYRESVPPRSDFLPTSIAAPLIDLGAWEKGVKEFFQHLDAVDQVARGGTYWLLWGPGLAVAGTAAAAIELARWKLRRRPLPDAVAAARRGVAWRWLDGPPLSRTEARP